MSTDKFTEFTNLVATAFQTMTKSQQVFTTAVEGDEVYKQYLAAFPPGTDPIFKKNTEHTCSGCRSFIRRVGNVVSVENGTITTVWDKAAKSAKYPYNEVAEHLRKVVLAHDISNLYRVSQKETSIGAAQSRSLEDGKAITWTHCHTGPIAKHLQEALPDKVCGEYKTTVEVFERGLNEISRSAIETVISLIEANNLYRGAEHRAAVEQFAKVKYEWEALDAKAKNTFAWNNATGPASRIRNTAIGTLLQDLTNGVEVDRAVRSFEAKVAPTNYKRTSAVITPAMIKKAVETIEQLGLEQALERRFAVIGDISVNDVKWVDSSVKPQMKGGLTETLMQHAATTSKPIDKEEHAEQISLDNFMTKIVPEATSMALLFKQQHLGNLVSLTAPVHPENKQLFRWDNDFAWSYVGNIADSIAERVKKAGGQVDNALLRVSLSWYNFDDLDLHVYEPTTRGANSLNNHIYFSNKRGWTGGVLDVDMNAGGGHTREAVENIVWMQTIPNGPYKVVVNNFAKRESIDVGFVIEIENHGKISHFSFNKTVRDKQDIHIATLHMQGGRIESMETGDPAITNSHLSQTKWNLTTEQLVKVKAITLSPNYWGNNASGNKHTFFLLEGAKNDEPTRGIYNEFLHPRLEEHRKVFEVIGDKTKCQPTDNQLSGLGFSSTKRDSVLIKVSQGKKQKLFDVQIGS